MSKTGKVKIRIKSNWLDYLYILPAVILVVTFFISSIIYTTYISFFDWNGIGSKIFVGFQNYISLFKDSNFLISLLNTVIWVAASMVTSLIIPFTLAALITRSSGTKLFRSVFYFPATRSGTVGGLIISSLLSTYGLPALLGELTGNTARSNWLNTPYFNTFLMICAGVWQGVGLNMLLFIAGIRNMDASPIESAMIDGAKGLKLYTNVVIPIIKPTILVVMLMTIVNSFKVFDIIWVTTKGGPYRTSETLAFTMYQESFGHGKYGRGSAVAVVLSLIILVISYFNIKNSYKDI